MKQFIAKMRNKDKSNEVSSQAIPPTNYRSFQNDDDSGRGHHQHDVLAVDNSRQNTTTPLSLPSISDVNNTTYRGFATSIHDVFAFTNDERVDCCALTCGGILQSDRDRYLLQGVTPPGLCRRLFLHFVLPVALFILAGLAALHVQNKVLNQIACVSILLMMLMYGCIQCCKGRSKRIEVRKDLLWTKYQLQQAPTSDMWRILEHERPDDDNNNGNKDVPYYLGQTKRDFRAAHPYCFCGCYPEDRSAEEINEESRNRKFSDLCRWLWSTCCGPTCGMHLQCCGVCALAQEGREVERLLPPSYRRVDYISMQPVAEYYPAIYARKFADEIGSDNNTFLMCGCLPPVSRLSKRILQVWAWLVALMFLATCGSEIYEKIALAHQHRYRYVPFSNVLDVYDFIVFSLEWVETLVAMLVFAWLVNRVKHSKLSFDALLKYFASGFVLSVITAIFWEVVVGLFLKATISIILILSGINVEEDPNKYSLTGMVGGFAATKIVRRLGGNDDDASTPNFLRTFGYDHPVIYTFIILIDAFVVAALIEETSKYFGYRMVEHPDFMSQEELDEAMTVANRHRDVDSEDDRYQRQDDDQHSSSTKSPRHDFSLQKNSKQAEGAAITLAMVAVAMGFTCCENFAYIFLYSGGSFSSELGTMIVRAFFPIHPLCAALQSLGVVKRDVEQDRSMKLGKILLPAILLHGSYDFFLLWIDFMYKRGGADALEDATDVLFSWGLSCVMVIVSLIYYVRQSRLQRERLINIDSQIAIDRSSLI